MNRRQFLHHLAGYGGALVMPGFAVVACAEDKARGLSQASILGGAQPIVAPSTRAPQYFIFYYMMGGWDLSLLTEPRPEVTKVHTPFSPGEVFEVNGHRYGPAMKPLRKYMDKMAILRGIRVEVLNHPQARFQLVTGKFKEDGQPVSGSLQTRLAQKLGAEYPLPSLSSDAIRPAVFLGDFEAGLKPVRVASLRQLEQLVEVQGATNEYSYRIKQAIADRDELLVAKYHSELAAKFDTYANLARYLGETDFVERIQQGSREKLLSLPKFKGASKWQRQAKLAVEVVKQDLAPVISVGSGEFDAHTRSEYGGHVRAVERGIRTVAQIVQGLAEHRLEGGETLLDRTTVVVMSEFSRTPWINELGGKHHWEANTVLMLGKGVRHSPSGPAVFGATDDLTFPSPINVRTGGTKGRTEFLHIHHAHATLLSIAGMDPQLISDQPPIEQLLA